MRVKHLTYPNQTLQDETLTIQRKKNKAAIRLLRKWLSDESGYDEETWPIVKKVIEENRLSDRRRFDD